MSLNQSIQKDQQNYNKKKHEIQAALNGSTGMIDGVTEENKEAIFYELLFCLCVPQSRANLAQEAINILREKGYYYLPFDYYDVLEIFQKRVRFHKTKALRVISAKQQFEDLWLLLKEQYRQYLNVGLGKDHMLREWRKEFPISGMGPKLVSQFFRNIGMRGRLAILDVHVLNSMKERHLIPANFKLTKQKYHDIEHILVDYSHKAGIELDHLDLLWWSDRTGYIHK